MPHFVLHYFLIGAKGVMSAVIVAAVMSSLSRDVNSVASVMFESRLRKRSLAKQKKASTNTKNSQRVAQLAGRLMVLLAGISVLIVAFSLVH